MEKNKIQDSINLNLKLLERLNGNLSISSQENKNILSNKIKELTDTISFDKKKLDLVVDVQAPKKTLPGPNKEVDPLKKRNRNFKHKKFQYTKEVFPDYAYQNYIKIAETIPEYMLKMLEKLPNNKGIIWRTIRMYGNLPRTNNYAVHMDERKNGEMFIHETTPSHQNLYRKNKNGTMGDLCNSMVRRKKKLSLIKGCVA